MLMDAELVSVPLANERFDIEPQRRSPIAPSCSCLPHPTTRSDPPPQPRNFGRCSNGSPFGHRPHRRGLLRLSIRRLGTPCTTCCHPSRMWSSAARCRRRSAWPGFVGYLPATLTSSQRSTRPFCPLLSMLSSSRGSGCRPASRGVPAEDRSDHLRAWPGCGGLGERGWRYRQPRRTSCTCPWGSDRRVSRTRAARIVTRPSLGRDCVSRSAPQRRTIAYLPHSAHRDLITRFRAELRPARRRRWSRVPRRISAFEHKHG